MRGGRASRPRHTLRCHMILVLRVLRAAPTQPHHEPDQRRGKQANRRQNKWPHSSADEGECNISDRIGRRQQARRFGIVAGGDSPGCGGRCAVRLRSARPFRQSRQLLQQGQVLLTEGSRPGGKYFEDSVDAAPALNRDGDNRAQPKAAADFDVDQRIILGICAMVCPTRAQTFSGNSRLCTQSRAQNGRGLSTAGATYHLAFLPHG